MLPFLLSLLVLSAESGLAKPYLNMLGKIDITKLDLLPLESINIQLELTDHDIDAMVHLSEFSLITLNAVFHRGFFCGKSKCIL